MNIFTLINSCDPVKLQAALDEDRSIINQRDGAGDTPYSEAARALKHTLSSLHDENQRPEKRVAKIQKLETRIEGLRAVVTILRDMTLQDAIDKEDIAMLNAMVKVGGVVIESEFETGPLVDKFPIRYAREIGKVVVVAWFEQRKEDVMGIFTGFQGKLFDASHREATAIEQQLRDLELSRIQETKEVIQGAQGELLAITKAAVDSARTARL